jgi:hypothetical protein
MTWKDWEEVAVAFFTAVAWEYWGIPCKFPARKACESTYILTMYLLSIIKTC